MLPIKSHILDVPVLPALALAIIASAADLIPFLHEDGILAGAMAFGLAPLAPALYLWLAYLVRLREPIGNIT